MYWFTETTMADLQIGDVVVLKSGGPKMTVDDNDNALVLCMWFRVSHIYGLAYGPGSQTQSPLTNYGKCESGWFNKDSLTKL